MNLITGGRRAIGDRRMAVAVSIVAPVAFVCHFLVIGVHLTPLNRVKLDVNPWMMGYVNPLFAQNWHLFAPDPVDSNLSLIGKCRNNAGESEWFDITYGILEGLEKRRFGSSLSAMAFLQLNLSRAYLHGFSEPEELLRDLCTEQPDTAYCLERAKVVEATRREALRGIVRLVTDFCVRNFSPDVQDVYARIADLRFPRFSSRSLPDSEGTVSYVNVGWHPAPGPR